MSDWLQWLRDLDRRSPAALVSVLATEGSAPRGAGTRMLVFAHETIGTIGGGQLEYMAIDKARQMLRTPTFRKMGTVLLDIPLGPEIGQCCGGRVGLSVRVVDRVLARGLLEAAEAQDAALPSVYVFGGGHVGHALAESLRLLPIRPIIVETRAEELKGLQVRGDRAGAQVATAGVRQLEQQLVVQQWAEKHDDRAGAAGGVLVHVIEAQPPRTHELELALVGRPGGPHADAGEHLENAVDLFDLRDATADHGDRLRQGQYVLRSRPREV